MGNGDSGSVDVFDVRKVRRLVELMKEYELAEVDLRQGDLRIRLRRGQEPIASTSGTVVHTGVSTSPMAASGMDSPAAVDEDANATYITSPMVGTFYSASSPESPPFVNVGDQVGPETTVCILEAMKVFNEIPAECSGIIAARLVENGDSIEFGQKLFKVQTST